MHLLETLTLYYIFIILFLILLVEGSIFLHRDYLLTYVQQTYYFTMVLSPTVVPHPKDKFVTWRVSVKLCFTENCKCYLADFPAEIYICISKVNNKLNFPNRKG